MIHHAHAFGLRWAADQPMPLFAPAPPDGRAADILVERVEALPPRAGGLTINNGTVFDDSVRFTFGCVVFEIAGGNRVRWTAPAPGDLPHAFYSTVAAIVLAWRGLVPLHVSAVAVDGRALLIAGPSGAGKSTLAAALVGCGARLISDDLSVLAPVGPGDTPMLWPGRPAVRLAPAGEAPAQDRDKMLVRPAMVDLDVAVPAAALLVLRAKPIPPGPAEAAAALRRQLFRPAWMRALPRAAERMATILHAAQLLAIHTMPPAPAVPEQSPDQRAEQAWALIGAAGARL